MRAKNFTLFILIFISGIAFSQPKKPDTKNLSLTDKDLVSYTGEYEHPVFGKISVKLENGQLALHYDAQSYKLEYYCYDIFTVFVPQDNGYKSLKFGTDKNGVAGALIVQLESNSKDIIFTKPNFKENEEYPVLTNYPGEYENPAYGKMSVKLENEELMVYYDSQSFKLEYYCYGIFTVFIKEGNEYKSIKFGINANGYAEALIVQLEFYLKDIVFINSTRFLY
jgi:hypothetical protein